MSMDNNDAPIVPDAGQSSAPAERKRAKRGRYIARACEFCQRRKIRCMGGTPCAACAAKRRDCLKVPQKSTPIFDRLEEVERRLESLAQGKPNSAPLIKLNRPSNNRRSSSTAFSGETSLDHTLSQVEDQLGAVGVDCSDRAPAGDGNLPSPVHSTLAFPVSDSDPTGLLRRALLSNEISLDRVRWDLRLQNFFDEIYILYPMLFIPDVKAIYNRLWDDWFLLPVEQDQQVALRYRMQVAQILLCLAAGACTVSRRASTENGKHAAGWSLYCTAMDVIGDLFALIESDSPMEALQTLVLIVVYLLPLDGIERGQKVLSIAISYAHQVGIHRQKMLNRMSFFDDEMYRRIWWCIYIMDRRYALETGRPFLTQDFNIDTAMPRNCSDEWLATHHKNPQTSLELAGSLDAHLLEDHSTPVPYLCTMAQYCRILGKVWEIMYGADNIDALPGRFQIEYLETLLSKYEAEIPFKYQESSEHRDSDAEWRHVKQRALTRMRISGLRLLIRQPLLRKPPSGPTEVQNYIGNEVMCLQFAHDIIERHLQIPDKHPKFLYPFIHYLANAATISLVILIKEPLFRPTYGAATILAVRTLRSYCTKTWVSGKLIRSVMRLNQMIAMVLGDDPASLSNSLSTNAPANGDANQNSVGLFNPSTHVLPDGLQASQQMQLANHNLPTNYPPTNDAADYSNDLGTPRYTPGPEFSEEAQKAVSHVSPDLMDMVITNFEFEEELSSFIKNGIEVDLFDPSLNIDIDHASTTDDWLNAFMGGF